MKACSCAYIISYWKGLGTRLESVMNCDIIHESNVSGRGLLNGCGLQKRCGLIPDAKTVTPLFKSLRMGLQ